MKLSNESINEAQKALENAKLIHIETIESIQSNCKHNEIAECDYKPETYHMYGLPPVRICLECGLTEEGWIEHNRVLKRPALGLRKIDREVLNTLRVGAMLYV